VPLWAVSDLILACPRYVERTSAWLEAWDRLPLGQFMFITQELSGRRPGFMRTPGQVFPGASPERELTIPPGLWPELSDRERELVQLILTGHPTATIAGRLVVTVGTVKNHRRRIYEKLDITTERELFLQFFQYQSP
jgi:DNA-binding CsgD family transcriptional regulator